MRMRVGEGEWFEFDGTKLMVREARELEELTGMGLQDFSDGMKRGKVDALVFMLYIAQKRQGHAVRWREFDDVDIAGLEIEDDDDGAATDDPDTDSGGASVTTVAGVPGGGPRPTRARNGKGGNRKRASG